MNENLFDDEEAKPTSNVMELSVTEISTKLKRMVEDTFGRVRVRGEIGRVSRPASGHIYLDLKDDRAVLAAVVWKGGVSKLKHKPEEGMEVVATGKLTTFPGSSKYQIIIEQIEPAGAGALMALLEERKRKLEQEGLFAPERKQLLPYMPTVVGVITSPTGAVIRDILHRLTDRFPLHVLVWPVRVQGETTGREVSWAINGFNAINEQSALPRPDVLIVARGGGSIEDLWGFNDEAVVRAVADSMIPVVAAVGHETDRTLIDLAADVRAPTPTAAAEMVVPVKADLEAKLATMGARLRSGLSRNLEQKTTGLKAAARGLPTPDNLFALKSQQLDSATSGLGSGLTSAIQAKSITFEKRSGRLGLSLLREPLERNGQQLKYHGSRLEKAQLSQIDTNSNRLQQAKLSHHLLLPVIQNGKQRFEFSLRAIRTESLTRFERLTSQLDQAGRLLESYSHENTLERGFTLVKTEDGTLISRVGDLKNDVVYMAQFADGAASIKRNDENKTSGKSKLGPTRSVANQSGNKKPSGSKNEQGNLFDS